MPSATCQLDRDTQRAPRDALRFRVPVTFAQKTADESGETPIEMLARSSQPIEHWYWGKVAHDFSGMQLRKPEITLDYCHDQGEIVGVAGEFDVQADGLHVTGKLVSVFAGDRVDQITKLAAKGVPYEASIDFYGPMKLERVRENEVAQCNGQQFEGPGIIVRQWMLNAVAVCPLGADHMTRSQFAAQSGHGEPADVEITFSSPETTSMAKASTTTNDSKSTDAPAAGQQLASQQNPPAPPVATALAAPSDDDPQKAFAAKLAQFTAEFGPVNGSKWAAEGKSYEEALKLHAAELSAQLKTQGEAKDGEIEALKAKLAAVDKGEETAVSFSDGGKPVPEKQQQLAAKLGSNLAAFAASIKMPEKAK